MIDVRGDVELRLRGNLLRDWCQQLAAADAKVSFDDGWCSGARTIRFATSTIDTLFGDYRAKHDCWGLGKLAFYEIESSHDAVSLLLRVSLTGLGKAQTAALRELCESVHGGVDAQARWGSDSAVVVSWDVVSGEFSANDAVAALEDVWLADVVVFEHALEQWLAGERAVRWSVPETSRELMLASELEGELFIEGAQVTVLTDRFERNKTARKRCIAAHGAVCAVCGMDFGKTYGEQFAGKIEVHHKVPLHEIREDYVVDPVNDLVPVCANCHMVIHSKPGGGAYSVEEVRAMMGERI